MPLEAPNNCWPSNLQSFADALVSSAAFQGMVGLPGGTADEVGKLVFGKRLDHSRSGHKWTADELATLRACAMVFSDPDKPFGYHLQDNHRYSPHGTVIIELRQLVPEADLVNPGDDGTGLTDVHDRQWHNIVGTIIKQMLEWLNENGGPYPVTNVDVTGDFETKASSAAQQGMWQCVELTFQYQVQ